MFSKKSNEVNFNQILFNSSIYGSISTKGLDFELFINVIQKDRIKYNSRLMLSAYKSIVSDIAPFNLTYASPGSPGFGSASLLRIEEGEEFGQIYAPEFEGIDADGYTIYKDVNNDGMIKGF